MYIRKKNKSTGELEKFTKDDILAVCNNLFYRYSLKEPYLATEIFKVEDEWYPEEEGDVQYKLSVPDDLNLKFVPTTEQDEKRIAYKVDAYKFLWQGSSAYKYDSINTCRSWKQVRAFMDAHTDASSFVVTLQRDITADEAEEITLPTNSTVNSVTISASKTLDDVFTFSHTGDINLTCDLYLNYVNMNPISDNPCIKINKKRFFTDTDSNISKYDKISGPSESYFEQRGGKNSH